VERAVARVAQLVRGQPDAEEALALDGEIEAARGGLEHTLRERLGGTGDLGASADLETDRIALALRGRRAGLAVRLVEERAEAELALLEAGGVRVRDVVGDRVDLRLLGLHARGGGHHGANHVRSPDQRAWLRRL
jgi:hypothetical protein